MDIIMNLERAKQIMDSTGVIEVMHENSPVWIEGIKGKNAEITYIESKKRVNIPLSELIEG